MTKTEPFPEIQVAVHFNRETDNFVVVSIDGDGTHGVVIKRSMFASFHLTGRTTAGTDRFGNKVRLPMANVELPHWLAKKEGFI